MALIAMVIEEIMEGRTIEGDEKDPLKNDKFREVRRIQPGDWIKYRGEVGEKNPSDVMEVVLWKLREKPRVEFRAQEEGWPLVGLRPLPPSW